jgi:hypothetical protein
MIERFIIPEDSQARLCFKGYDVAQANYRYSMFEEDNVAPKFSYDADFIESALNEGYLKTLERFKNPMSMSDDKKTDMLLKDMINATAVGQRAVEESFFSETARFVRAPDRVNSDVGGLIEGKIPVSDEIWLRADFLSNALVASVRELRERIEKTESDGSDFRYGPTQIDGSLWIAVEGLSPRGINRNFRFTIPVFLEGTIVNSLYWMPFHEDFNVYFHFRFDPTADKISEAWRMQSALNTGYLRNNHSEFYLLSAGAGAHFKEVIEPSWSVALPLFQRMDEVRKKSDEVEKRITRGLIRIQNHLNNPGMSDEEYLSLINV